MIPHNHNRKPRRPRMVAIRRRQPCNRMSAYCFIPRSYRHPKDLRWADSNDAFWSATLYEDEFGNLFRRCNPKGDTPPRHVRLRNGPDPIVLSSISI